MYSRLWTAVYTLMAVCWVILRGQQIYTVIQAVHSLLYIVARCHFFSVVTWKDIIKYFQKCEGCTHFCEILYITYIRIAICFCCAAPLLNCSAGNADLWRCMKDDLWWKGYVMDGCTFSVLSLLWNIHSLIIFLRYSFFCLCNLNA